MAASMTPKTPETPVIVLTGGGSGIGLTVLTLLLKTYDVNLAVLTLCPTGELSVLEKQYGKERLAILYGDACNDALVAEFVDLAVSSFSYITHVIHCISTMVPVETIEKVSLDSFRRIYDINVFTAVSLVQKCIPHLRKAPMPAQGATKPTIIIVTSGVDVDIHYHGWSAYCSSKAALTRFIQILAHEQQDMSVFGVLPLVTKSPMANMVIEGKYDHVMLPEERERFNVWQREGKVEPPEYIADAIIKAAMGNITPASPEVERNVCGALFIGSMYQK